MRTGATIASNAGQRMLEFIRRVVSARCLCRNGCEPIPCSIVVPVHFLFVFASDQDVFRVCRRFTNLIGVKVEEEFRLFPTDAVDPIPSRPGRIYQATSFWYRQPGSESPRFRHRPRCETPGPALTRPYFARRNLASSIDALLGPQTSTTRSGAMRATATVRWTRPRAHSRQTRDWPSCGGKHVAKRRRVASPQTQHLHFGVHN